VKGVPIGRRSGTLQRFRILLFEDRIEDVSIRLDGLEVRRLFFDELQSATVHRRKGVVDLVAGSVLTGLLLTIALVSARPAPPVAAVFAGIALATGALTALALAYPRHWLVVYAPDQKIEIPLSRSAARRDRTLARVVRTIGRYQDHHASPRTASEPDAQAPEPPPPVPPRPPSTRV